MHRRRPTFAPPRILEKDEPVLPYMFGRDSFDTSELSLDVLVSMREKHQTSYVSRSACIQTSSTRAEDSPELSMQRQILHTYYDSLRGSQDHGITTGEERWQR